MTNRLPEKLMLLRKNKGYSQNDIAEHLDVPVSDYMNWENGNAICNIEQLKALADLFDVKLDALADNRREVITDGEEVPPVNTMTIPYLPSLDRTESLEKTQPIEKTQSLEKTQTITSLDHTKNLFPEDNEKTMEVNTKTIDASNPNDTDQFAPTMINEIVDDDDFGTAQEETVTGGKKSRIVLILSLIIAALLLAFVAWLFLGNPGETLTLSSDNRLALGDTYSLYIDSNGSLERTGEEVDTTALSETVQVSIYSNYALGLKSDGTVAATNSTINSAISNWKSIIKIAAGKNHAVGLKKDGTVVCTGSAQACEVDTWQNVKSVYAGNEITVGITETGSVLVSGNVSADLSAMTNARDAAVNDNELVILKSDGTAVSYPIGSGTTTDVSAITGASRIVAGNNFVCGLTGSGDVVASGNTEELEALLKKVTSWKNIRFLAARGGTVIAVDKSGARHGAGDNTYNIYTAEESEDPVETDEPTEKISNVTNVSHEVYQNNIIFTWNEVEDAAYYEVRVDATVSAQKTADPQISIPVTSFEQGQVYTVRIVTYPEDETKYLNSEETVYTFTYEPATVKLADPSGITDTVSGSVWTITWDVVEHADYYMVTFNKGQPVRVDKIEGEAPSIALVASEYNLSSGVPYEIVIQAYSNDTVYTPSNPVSTTRTYVVNANQFSVRLMFIKIIQDAQELVSDVTVWLNAGTYTAAEASEGYVPSGCEVVPDQDSLTIGESSETQEFNIYVTCGE